MECQQGFCSLLYCVCSPVLKSVFEMIFLLDAYAGSLYLANDYIFYGNLFFAVALSGETNNMESRQFLLGETIQGENFFAGNHFGAEFRKHFLENSVLGKDFRGKDHFRGNNKLGQQLLYGEIIFFFGRPFLGKHCSQRIKILLQENMEKHFFIGDTLF